MLEMYMALILRKKIERVLEKYKGDIKMNIVSIIVPMYNAKPINRTLDSIINQSYKDIEIIVVMMEVDNSNEIVKRY